MLTCHSSIEKTSRSIIVLIFQGYWNYDIFKYFWFVLVFSNDESPPFIFLRYIPLMR